MRPPLPGKRPRPAAPAGAGGRAGSAVGGNLLLAALPRQEAASLGPLMERIGLVPGAVLTQRGQEIEHLVFPESGIVSLLVECGPGESAEVALIGREGVLGLFGLLGGRTAPHRAVVRIGGEARRLPVGPMRSALHGSLAVRDLFLRHAGARLAQVATSAACAALHPVRQRAAGRLLDIQDRAGPGFPLTQEFLAGMLGVRRPTVNAVLQELKAEGLLRTTRGRIVITDAAALEAVACGCRQRRRGMEAELGTGTPAAAGPAVG